jgi:F-type H+-transporting ATPase subunit gamma
MSRIAAARLVKAQQAAMAARPYGERLEEVVRALVTGTTAEGRGRAPCTRCWHRAQRAPIASASMLLTADRGLAGGFNANVNRAALTVHQAANAGRAAARSMRDRGRQEGALVPRQRSSSRSLASTRRRPSLNLVERAKEVSAEVMALFDPAAEGPVGCRTCDAVYLAYNYFQAAC